MRQLAEVRNVRVVTFVCGMCSRPKEQAKERCNGCGSSTTFVDEIIDTPIRIYPTQDLLEDELSLDRPRGRPPKKLKEGTLFRYTVSSIQGQWQVRHEGHMICIARDAHWADLIAQLLNLTRKEEDEETQKRVLDEPSSEGSGIVIEVGGGLRSPSSQDDAESGGQGAPGADRDPTDATRAGGRQDQGSKCEGEASSYLAGQDS